MRYYFQLPDPMLSLSDPRHGYPILKLLTRYFVTNLSV
ncbi:hypothetical protein SAMN06265348_10648 [Pedobacter westerhofensis]|uniref:Uncharacterized protein n=1 Tax=Pedobacter westerhofensis TaxID=425512 RepID=A0A521DR02_9SPHI|nr:hypothetical protein SAMN06265348_10648 [Pedobacter westerhofensis]